MRGCARKPGLGDRGPPVRSGGADVVFYGKERVLGGGVESGQALRSRTAWEVLSVLQGRAVGPRPAAAPREGL